DRPRVAHLVAREDDEEGTARALLVGASVASLLGAGYALHLAGQQNGLHRAALITVAVATVVLSWTLINTVYTLRYADQDFGSARGGIEFGGEDGQERPSYRDFAYVAFTIGMTYQVSNAPARGAGPRLPAVPVRRVHRGGLGQPHLGPVPLFPPAEPPPLPAEHVAVPPCHRPRCVWPGPE